MEWLKLLLPPFLELVEALVAENEDSERAAMIALQVGIARAKAEKKFGPHT